MFFKYNFKMNDSIVNKYRLVSFYNSKLENNFNFAPKLTRVHIYLGPFKKMRIYLAA